MNTLLVFIALLVLPLIVSADESTQPERVLFFGDSITEEGLTGTGYISLLPKLLPEALRHRRFAFIGAGIRGDQITDLKARFARDVLSRNPNTVVIYIGVNDAFKAGSEWDDGKRYSALLREMTSALLAEKIRVILCTPTVIGEKNLGENSSDARLEQLASYVRKISQELKTPLCDLRSAFVKRLQAENVNNLSQGILTRDGVHLNPAGNRLVAESIAAVL